MNYYYCRTAAMAHPKVISAMTKNEARVAFRRWLGIRRLPAHTQIVKK